MQDNYNSNCRGANALCAAKPPPDGRAWEAPPLGGDGVGPNRVYRGGSWASGPTWAKVTARQATSARRPGMATLGLRVAWSVPAKAGT